MKVMRLAVAVAALSCTATQAAHAQSRGAVFAGADSGRDASAYVGVSAPLGANGDWTVRAVFSKGDYDYQSGSTPIDADFKQAEVSLLRSRSGAWGYLNFGVGARVTQTDLSPADAGNDRSGRRWDALVTADGARRMGPWEATGYAAYGVDMREYFVRADVTRALGSGPWRLGAEIIAEGDPAYDRQGVGAVLAYRPNATLSLRAAVGDRGGEAYGGLALVRTF